MKITFIGAGSLFFESVSVEIASSPELHDATISLFDPDAARLDLIQRVTVRISAHFGANLQVVKAESLAQALEGADVVISSIGVHGPGQSWHQLDVEAVAQLGIMQTTGDTVGPTGISQGLRLIPLYIHLAREMERYCPNAWLLNHSNPMGPICRAVSKFTQIRVIGYCHNVAYALRNFAKFLNVNERDLDAVVAGINHQVWLLSLLHKGKDALPQLRGVFANPTDDQLINRRFTLELMELTGLYLLGGDRHVLEFFPHARKPAKPKDIGYKLKWRRDMITGNLLSAELSKDASDLGKRASGDAPLIIPKEVSPEAMGHQITALLKGSDIVHVVNLPNEGAVPNAPSWAVLEMKAVIGMNGACPVHVGELPPVAARWTLAQIYAHELLVDAAAEQSRFKAIQALACDPMVRDFSEPEKILDALVAAQGERLAAFRAQPKGRPAQ